MTKGKSPRDRHLIITVRASIRIITIITVLTNLIYRSLWRGRRRSNEAIKAKLSLWYTTDVGVHLTQLIRESVKTSTHALKLRHDSLEGHITSWGRRCRGGKSSWSSRTSKLHTRLLQSKLGLTPLNRTGVDGTHGGIIRRIRNGDGKNGKGSVW